MSRSKSLLVSGILTIGCVFLGAWGTNVITGVVEHSFDENVRFLRTKDKIYELKVGPMSADLRKRFDRVGARVSIAAPREMVEAEWRHGLSDARSETEGVSSEVVAEAGESTIFVGTVLPSVATDDAFVEAGGTIYRIDSSKVPHVDRLKLERSRRGAFVVPTSSIVFKWSKPSSDGATRLPASEPRADERYALVDHVLKISGTVQHGSDERNVIVRSGKTYFLIDRRALESESGRGFQSGSKLSAEVPESKVVFTWSE